MRPLNITNNSQGKKGAGEQERGGLGRAVCHHYGKGGIIVEVANFTRWQWVAAVLRQKVYGHL